MNCTFCCVMTYSFLNAQSIFGYYSGMTVKGNGIRYMHIVHNFCIFKCFYSVFQEYCEILGILMFVDRRGGGCRL